MRRRVELQFTNEFNHGSLLLPRDLREHRQRQDAALIAMRVRKLFGTMLEPAIGGEKR
jgi:hypothetical protein